MKKEMLKQGKPMSLLEVQAIISDIHTPNSMGRGVVYNFGESKSDRAGNYKVILSQDGEEKRTFINGELPSYMNGQFKSYGVEFI